MNVISSATRAIGRGWSALAAGVRGARFSHALPMEYMAALVVTACSPMPVAFAQPCGEMQDLGTLPGGCCSYAYGVSADGSVVVGLGNSNTGGAFRWTLTNGMQGLGALSGSANAYSTAYGVSADGSVVVGWSDSTSGRRAFRWTSGGAMQDLGTLPGRTSSEAQDVSADGSVVVGYSSSSSGSSAVHRAFRWTAVGGMQDLGTLPGGTSSIAFGVSADGATVVGWSDSSGGRRAFRWTQAGGMQDLGTLPGGTESEAQDASADGSVVVGSSRTDSGRLRAFRWTAAEGMQDLGTLPGGTESGARDVSADGTVVVGIVPFVNTLLGPRAFRWSLAAGMQDLGTVPGVVSFAQGISADGSVVVGYLGYNGTPAFRWTVGALPSFSQQPGSATACRNGTTVLSVTASGTEPLTYQWQWRPAPNASWVDAVDGVNADPSGGPVRFTASGARSAAVTVRPEGGSGTAGSHWEKRCIVTNPCGNTPSDPASITYCAVDVNCINGVSVQDIFDFLAAWFAGNTTTANFNGDCCISVQDIFDFLAAWFVGC